MLAFAFTACERTADESRKPETAAQTEAPAYETVVAVSKSIGDLWLLAGGKLAGITEDGQELPYLNEDAAMIGTVTNPSVEAIVALEPDMVLLSGELPTHAKLQETLESKGINCKAVSIDSFEDYAEIMKEFTGYTEREDCYQENVVQVSGKIEGIKAQAAGSDLKTGTYLALRVSATKNKALKDSYFACEIFNDLGLTNIAQDNSIFDELNVEAIVAADPQIIFVIEQGRSSEAQNSFTENFAGKAAWKELTAVKNGDVYTLPKDLFQYKPNAEWDRAYEYVFELLEK